MLWRDIMGIAAAPCSDTEPLQILPCQDVSCLTYWVCAFSINQHGCICNSFGNPPVDQEDFQEWDEKRHDTVTGKVLPLCDCKERKVFSTEPNTCELNKFHWMMRHSAWLQLVFTLIWSIQPILLDFPTPQLSIVSFLHCESWFVPYVASLAAEGTWEKSTRAFPI